jgi:energy-coupling factor transport system permease protein
LPRTLHPGAWWLWALGLAAAASRTTNPVLLALVLAVAALVVTARRPVGGSANAFRSFLVVGVAVIGVRLVFQVLFGAPVGSTVLVTLPELPLPEWAAGVRVGGPVTLEALVLALYQGLQLAVILACFGAANELGDARRLLRSMPGALYEVGVAVVVALTFAPRLVDDLVRVRAARRLRGRERRRVRDLGRVAVPVLEGSLDGALALAAAMDARGFGRQATLPAAVRRRSGVLLLGAMVGVCAGLYGLLTAAAPAVVSGAVLGAGLAAAGAGLALAGRRSTRTRYRRPPWAGAEWLVTACGLAAAAGFTLAASTDPAAMDLLVVPLAVPAVPAAALAGALVATLPAWLTPPPPAGGVTAGPPARRRERSAAVAA